MQIGSLGWVEILLIGGAILLLFGTKKLPDIGKGLGKAITNFKRSVRETEPDENSDSEKADKSDNDEE
jgi:sec-independent protein translocase protein TatA